MCKYCDVVTTFNVNINVEACGGKGGRGGNGGNSGLPGHLTVNGKSGITVRNLKTAGNPGRGGQGGLGAPGVNINEVFFATQ